MKHLAQGPVCSGTSATTHVCQIPSQNKKVSEVQMCELQTALVIGRARYEGWLGTEPEEIAAAAEALSRLERDHPLLPELERRLSRARQIKRLLSYCGWRAEHLL